MKVSIPDCWLVLCVECPV